jgi:alpha-glucosidase
MRPAQNPHLWWQRGVIYQIYPRSFQDSDGDGTGDLQGITQRLDYLSNTLGVDAIWLSPIYPSPLADFGYDISDYVDVHPIFGDLATFDALVSQAHARDLAVIIDYVPNHTSDQHPWFLESRSSRDNPQRDWYVWRDARPDGSPPNNWLSVFGGGAWEWDPATGQYYLHSFLKEQPDLNWRNPDVKAAMLDVLRFWLARGVDGFRIDVAHFIMKDPELRDNPPNPDPPLPGAAAHEYQTQLHAYDKGHPDVHAAFRDIRAVLDEYSAERPRMAVGEIHVFDWPVWASYYGEKLDELHLPFNFGLIFSDWTAAAVRAVVDGVEGALRPGAWPNYVLGNHDVHRVATRLGPEQARLGMMLLLTLRGTPTLYYGEEIGMHDVEIPPDRVQDPFEKNVPGLGLGRDPERTPMQWSTEPNAGFCPAGVEPWLPVAQNHRRLNVEMETGEPGSMLALTRELIRLRRANPALTTGSYRPVEVEAADCFVYLREQEDDRWAIALNFSGVDRVVTAPELGGGAVALSTFMDRAEVVDLAELRLGPDEGCMVELTELRPFASNARVEKVRAGG